MTEQITVTSDKIVERAPVPEILVDGYSGAMVINGVVKINCFSITMTADSGGPAENRAVCRLAMTVPSLVSIHRLSLASIGHLET